MKMKRKSKEQKKQSFVQLWRRRLLDILKQDISMHPKLRDYNFYSNGSATFSGKDYVTYYYTIDGYPKEVPIDFRNIIRKEACGGVRVSFISIFEPTRIDWNSARMRSKLRTWRSIDEESDDVDEFNYQQNLDSMDSMVWRKQSLLYLADAEKRRKRRLFRYRVMMIITGIRGDGFDKSVFEIQNCCKSRNIKITRVDSDISSFMRYFSPFCLEYSEAVVKSVGSNTIPDELLARFSTYDQGKIGNGGDYWGTDIYSGFPVYKKLKKNSVDAEVILITAKTGGGKSFFLKVLLLQLFGNKYYNGTINDIEGFEYIPLAGFLANQSSVVILNMAEGQGCYFDPVEICLTGDTKMDEGAYSISNSFTLAIIKALLGKSIVDNDWADIAVNHAVSKTYSDAGVDIWDMDTWSNSKGLTLFDVYNKFKVLYKECMELIRDYGYSTNDSIPDAVFNLELSQQCRRNPEYKNALDLVIAKLSAYFEPLERGGSKSYVFSKRVALEEVSQAKLVICSFGLAGKSLDSVDRVQLGLSQLSASLISYIRSIFSKAVGKYNFKVWEEFQRWGAFPGSDMTIKTAITGGRKLGDVNFILTNDVKELLDKDRFSIFQNITSSVIGAIADDDTRSRLCKRLSIPLLKDELDNLVVKKGNTESFSKDQEMSGKYDKAFVVSLDSSVATVVKMIVPQYIADSDLFKTGIDLEG